jgi:hypothetical protein
MFDGKRHVLIGGKRNHYGRIERRGTISSLCLAIPREVYAEKEGFLCTRPVAEATAVFNQTVLDLATKPDPDMIPLLRAWLPEGTLIDPWEYQGNVLVNSKALRWERAHCSFDAPDDYMLRATVRLDHQATFTVGFREQQGKRNSGYKLVINRRTDEVEIRSPAAEFPRHVRLNPHEPITVQAFMIGSILECWVNDAHAFSLRAYDFPEGQLSFEVSQGKARIQSMTVSIAGDERCRRAGNRVDCSR